MPLRAAYLHGPYTVYVACYPSTFSSSHKFAQQEEHGEPDYEPQLKAGGSWTAKLKVPEEVRRDADNTGPRNEDNPRKSFTWIIEVASQVLFSTTASVHFEVLVGRDEKSVELGFHGVVGSGQGAPGKLDDHQQGHSRNAAHSKGVFSKAVNLVVDDTESLWNTPAFPEWDDDRPPERTNNAQQRPKLTERRTTDHRPGPTKRKQKKVHLVLLTHGIHSNLGADMLYMKESIDAAAKQAKEDARKRRADLKAQKKEALAAKEGKDLKSKSTPELALASNEDWMGNDDDSDDDEEVLVRGFAGNAVKTERGIQFLGKRFAKFVLSVTYPDQPYLPVKSSIGKSISRSLTGGNKPTEDGKKPIHKNSSIVKDEKHMNHNLPYKITSISFIAHSLGGLTQTYAIAYIQKHSPEFFDLIKPVNFVAMASPFLGLSNENPIYVKFALDFGLVGRTGQDLGLSWRAPTIAKNGWGTMMGAFNTAEKDQKETDPRSKPLMRILPTGPAHVALKKFMNRTVYSNVVNDGIVPLRTSCLLFLDWRGLERVEKARRDNGLVGTMLEWGVSEMLGANVSGPRKPFSLGDIFGDERSRVGRSSPDPGSKVPGSAAQGMEEDNDDQQQTQYLDTRPFQDEAYDKQVEEKKQSAGLWSQFMYFFKPQASPNAHHHQPKKTKIYRRGQISIPDAGEEGSERESSSDGKEKQGRRGPMVRGASLYSTKTDGSELQAPPKTTFFESAGDLLNPPLPPKEFILDPAKRPRTIFHDRVYHPDDIPQPPVKKPRTFLRRTSSREASLKSQHSTDSLRVSSDRRPSSQHSAPDDAGGMKIEEKIARAYHKDLSWRKVLVRLEPDAHNNMVVRRMFANAYGWPVVQHMCDTHFAYTAAARTRDEDEHNAERARPAGEKVGPEGERVTGQVDMPSEEHEQSKMGLQQSRSVEDLGDEEGADTVDELRQDRTKFTTKPANREKRTESEIRESRDEMTELVSRINAVGSPSSTYTGSGSSKASLGRLTRMDSGKWSDQYFEGSDDDSDDEQLLKELEEAKARGQQLTEAETRAFTRLSNSSKASKQRSHRSNKSDGSDKAPVRILRGDHAGVMTEPGEMEPSEREELEEAMSPERQGPSLTGVGLGKEADAEVNPDSPKNTSRKGSLGVSEQVAFAQAKAGGDEVVQKWSE